MAEYKIGSLKLENPYFLAPMVGVNDIAFRILCKEAGAGMVYTGMTNPLTREELILEDKPAIQMFSTSEKGVSEFIKKHEKTALLFDFNLGCSAHTAEKRGFGAFLPNKIEVIQKILKVMRESTKKPITIKLRKSNQTLKIARIAEKYCDAICIHPRTDKQGYSGKADVDFAEKLKQKTSLPIIYSGDVDEKNADELLKKFDFVMIGRKAMGCPNIFAKLTGKKPVFGFNDVRNSKIISEQPKNQYDFFAYLDLALKYKLSFSHVRSQSLLFTKGCEGASELRAELSKAKKFSELKKILENKK
jgi:tRNA-dihydrouridine synthase